MDNNIDENEIEITRLDSREYGFFKAGEEPTEPGGTEPEENGSDGGESKGVDPADDAAREPEKKKKLPLGLKIALILLAVILALVAAAFIFVNCTVDRYIGKINYTHDPYDPFDTSPIEIASLPDDYYDDETDSPGNNETPGPTEYVDPTELPPDYTATPVPTATIVPTSTPTATPIPTSDVDDEADLLMSDKVYNILIIGTDTRDEQSFRGNSDVIMLVSFNSVTRKIWLTSFHRDSYVEISGVGYRKINSAYAYGGAKLLQRTIQEDFLVVAPYYCIVNFDSFVAVVDAIGGVEIAITKEEAEKGTVPGITEAGTYTLNGSQALSYARERHLANDDWGRTQRHRNVVSAVIKKLKTQSVTQLLSTMDVLLPLITTNIPKNEIKSLVYKAPEYSKYSVNELSIPKKGTWHNAYLKRTQETIVIDSFWKNVVYIRDNVYDGAL